MSVSLSPSVLNAFVQYTLFGEALAASPLNSARFTRRRSPAEWATIMAIQGYRFRFTGEGEALIRKPDDTLYTVSLTGATFPLGCSCSGGRLLGRCKHMAIVTAFRPCDAPRCSGIQQYRDCETLGGPVPVFGCSRCHKTTAAGLVYEARRLSR